MNLSSAWLILLGIPFVQAANNPGIGMTIERGQPDRLGQETIYLQADRKRMEFRNGFGRRLADGSEQPIYGPHLAAITRCDLGLSFELNLDTHEYTATPYPPKPFTKSEMEARGMPLKVNYVSDKPTLRIEITTTDAGERKEIFGYTARHVITGRKQIPLEGAVSDPQESVTDAWYIDANSIDPDIDLHQRLPCDQKWPEGKRGHAYSLVNSGNRPIDRPEFVTVGEAEAGFALQSTMTSKNTYAWPDGTKKQSDSKFEVRVTQLDKGPLDPMLFEIPPGFKLVDHIERNPPASAFASQPMNFWQRVRVEVARLFR